MTLRNRLLLALLALALLPTVVFTVFTLDQLDRSIDRWYRPGVARALEAGLDIGKSSLARIEGILSAQGDEWSGRWTGALTQAQRDQWSTELRNNGIDFVQVYHRAPDRTWRRVEQVVPKGLLAVTPLDLSAGIDSSLANNQPLRSPLGALADVDTAANGDAVLAGIIVHPEFFGEIESLGQGAVHYEQLGVYVDLQRRVYGLLVALVVIALVTVAWFLSQAIARQTARPISALSEALEQLASGDLTTRVAPAGAAELRSLGSSFNAMAERLADARDAEQRAEREAAWRDVARKLAHEFKNILTPMQLSLQLIEAQIETVPETGRDAFRRGLASALREVDHLNRLAGQFSQYARLPEPRFEPVELGELVRAVVEDLGMAGVHVHAERPVGVQGDRLLLTRAIHNLLLNAREASPPGTPVDIAVTERENRGVIEVLDRGTGLPADLQPRLFEPYVSTKRRGSGLGLSLVRDIVQQHDGAVALENRDGGGARAIVILPRAPVRLPDRDPVAAPDEREERTSG